MTQTAYDPVFPGTAAPVLEARNLTKHFQVRRGPRSRSAVHAVENV